MSRFSASSLSASRPSPLESLSQEHLSLLASDPQLAELVLEERRRRVRRSYTDLCTEVLSSVSQTPAAHHRLIIKKLEQISSGKIDRLAIFAPPGSAKSTYATVLFPAFWFIQHPRSAIISASHTGDLAESFGRRVRNLVDEHHDMLGYAVSPDSRAASGWSTTTGGSYVAAGVGMAIAGRRADLAIIDDPVKSREAADSEVERDKTWNWYRGDLYNRLKPKARIILIQTRWHEDDLGGRLLQDMAGGADQWDILMLPALADSPDDPLGREIGESLWPEWEDREALLRKKRVIGTREWASQFQQKPAPEDGSIFDVSKLVETVTMPEIERPTVTTFRPDPLARVGMRRTELPASPLRPAVVRAWDLSSTAQVGSRDPDWTVGVKMHRLADGRYFIEDVVRMRGSPSEVEQVILATARVDGVGVPIVLPRDPGSAGAVAVMYLTRSLAGYRVISTPVTKSKEVRATPLASQMAVGNVWVLKASWTRTLREELAVFPSGSHDDIVDSLADAFNFLIPPSVRQRSHTAPAIALYRR
jgi:predicted phage terminase large subunit-like protein